MGINPFYIIFQYLVNILIYNTLLNLFMPIWFSSLRRCIIGINLMPNDMSEPLLNRKVFTKLLNKLLKLRFSHSLRPVSSKSTETDDDFTSSLINLFSQKNQDLYFYASYNRHQLYNVHLTLIT